MALFENLDPKVLFFAIAVLGISIIILLKKIESSLSTRIIEGKNEKKQEDYFKIQIIKLKKSNSAPEAELKNINNLARNFLIKTFNKGRTSSYYDLSEFFRKKGKQNIENFCQKMVEIYYSGEKIDKSKLKELIIVLEKIIETESVHEPKTEEIKPSFKDKIMEKIKQINKIEKKSEQQIKKMVDLPSLDLEEEKETGQEDDLIEKEEMKKEMNEKTVIEPRMIEKKVEVATPKLEFKKEKIKFEKIKIKKNEPKEYKYIESIDMLDRIKQRMKNNSFAKN